MKRTFAVIALVAAAGFAGARDAHAQDAVPGPGTVVVTIAPGGATFFTEGKNAKGPSFGNYDLGAEVAVNVNRFVGIEGGISGALGVPQDLELTAGQTLNDERSPHILNYNANLVLSAPNRSAVVPYVTGGVGGLSLFERTALGITGTETFLTGNVGGGVSWYAGRWGLRGDYRFITVRSKDDAPAFWGAETRYGHRIYGGILLNVTR
jgi:hypothetical protein